MRKREREQESKRKRKRNEKEKVLKNLGSDKKKKKTSYPSRADPPAAPVVRVRPQQVAHGALVGHLLDPVQGADVVERVEGRGEPPVEAEDGVVDRRGQRQVVEEVREVLPDVGVAVLAQALVVEAVDLRDLPRLVVAAQDSHAVAVPHLERDEQRRRLDRVVAAVDVVAHEEVVRVGGRAPDAEELEEVLLVGWCYKRGGGREGEVSELEKRVRGEREE